MSTSLSPTATRLAAENARQAQQRDRDVWASAVAHWQQVVDERRQIHDETAAAVGQAFMAMQADNRRFGRPIFVNGEDPSSISGPQGVWRNADKQLETARIEMNRATALLDHSRQQLELLDAALAG